MKVAAALLGLLSTANAVVLTPDNWDAETSGKTVFIKFYAPWCGHCKAMKPDWETLMGLYADSTTKLIGDVDCTAEGEPLCGAHGVQGFPTLKWGSPDDLQEYEGERDLESLKAFAENELKPLCSIANIDLCDDDKKKQIASFQAMSPEALDKAIEELEKRITDSSSNFEEQVQILQDTYEKLVKEQEATAIEVKAAGLGLMKSIKSAASAGDSKDEL